MARPAGWASIIRSVIESDLVHQVRRRLLVIGDLRELWCRLILSLLISNYDDHLRNHGFIREAGGWRLAPAYDLNPSTKKDAHVLALDDASAEPDLDTVLHTADFYKVTPQQAQED